MSTMNEYDPALQHHWISLHCWSDLLMTCWSLRQFKVQSIAFAGRGQSWKILSSFPYNYFCLLWVFNEGQLEISKKVFFFFLSVMMLCHAIFSMDATEDTTRWNRIVCISAIILANIKLIISTSTFFTPSWVQLITKLSAILFIFQQALGLWLFGHQSITVLQWEIRPDSESKKSFIHPLFLLMQI